MTRSRASAPSVRADPITFYRVSTRDLRRRVLEDQPVPLRLLHRPRQRDLRQFAGDGRDQLKATVLEGSEHQLMHPEFVTAFVDGFHREVIGREPNYIGTAIAPSAISRRPNERSEG